MKRISILSYCCWLLLLGSTIFFWDGMDILTPFLYPLVYSLMWILFGASCLLVVVATVRTPKEQRKSYFRLLAMNIAVACLVLFVPLAQLEQLADFYLNQSRREHVVALAINNQLRLSQSYNKELFGLPAGLRDLSKGGGEVVITNASADSDVNAKKIHVSFYTYRGILDRYAAFEYCADGKPPKEAQQIQHLNGKWFWCSY